MLEDDVVVIGSGFAGAVAAARLIDAGFSVTMLERGPWRDTQVVRQMGVHRRSPLPVGWRFISHLLRRVNKTCIPTGGITFNRSGVYEMHSGEMLDVVCSSQVGGGSHVYGGLNMRPAAPDYWDGHHHGVNGHSMAAHYDYVFGAMGSMIPLQVDGYPNMFAERMAVSGHFVTDQRSQDLAMGLSLSRATGPARLSSSGLLGSEDGTKKTVDDVFLRNAIGKGLTIHDLCEVTAICREDVKGRSRYRIRYRDHGAGKGMQIATNRLIVAAGTMNTLKLLLHSRDVSRGLQGMPALGKYFSSNGDYAAYWHHGATNGDLSVGLPTRGKILLSEPHRWDSARPWPLIVEGSLPYSAQLPGLPLLGRLVKQGTLLAGMGNDGMIGRVSYRGRSLHIDYDPGRVPVLGDLRQAFDLIAQLSGNPVTHFPRALSMHPLGGARLASSPESGVIDATGQVYGHPGLFVADGAALPAALGVAPSMSIAAWASHVAQGIISRQGLPESSRE